MSLKGIDVSAHQGVIDWKKVKDSGIEFVIIRAGYGINNVDKYFRANIEGAIKAGLTVGVYWFMYALTEVHAVQNAKTFIKTISPYKSYITLKAACDFEGDTEVYAKKHGVYFNKDMRTRFITLFCEELKANGYEAAVYLNPDYLKSKVNKLDYPLWLAQYATKKSYDCYMWQYSSKGRVNGINGNVDMNVWYKELEALETITASHNNPYSEPTRTLYKKIPCMRGDDVKWLQTELIYHGCLPKLNAKGKSNVDGILGNDTSTAIKVFQSKVGITVDGKCGKVTREYLKK